MYIPRALADLSATDSGVDSSAGDDKLKWIIAAVISSVLVIVAVGVYVIVKKVRARNYEEAQQRDPHLSRKEYTRVRKLSSAERVEEQETQRAVMIRKSLATRSTLTSLSSMTSRNSSIQTLDEDEEIDLSDDEPRGMKEDWKEFEARVKKVRSGSGEVHPISRTPSPIHSRTLSSDSQTPLLQPHQTPRIQLHPPPGLAPQQVHPALAGHPAFSSEHLAPCRLAGLRPVHIAKG